MGRIDTSRWHTKSKHEQTIIDLLGMVADLRSCLEQNAPIDPTTRHSAISTIGICRRDVERCTTPISDMIRYQKLFDPHIMDHADLIICLADLSIQLKLHRPYDNDMLDKIVQRTNGLENCREDTRLYRAT